MNLLDTVWLAAWLEGEGWFGLSNKGISLQATSTDLDIIKRVQALIDAPRIYEKRKQQDHHQQAYTVRVGGDKAEAVMRAILPYMGERRGARIEELLLHRAGEFERRSNAAKRRWADPMFRERTSLAIRKARKGGGNQYTKR